VLRNYAVDFVEICNIYVRKVIIKAAKKIFNSDKICRSYSDLNFGVTFFGTQCILCSKYCMLAVYWASL